MGWSPGQQGIDERNTYRQRHGYGEYTGPRMRPPVPIPPPSTNIPGLPPPPAGGATGSGTAQDVNGRRQYWTGTEWHDTPSQRAGLPTQPPPAAPAPPGPPVPQGVLGNTVPLSQLRGGPPVAPQPAPGPSPLVAGIQQMIGPQESDPYEAWKAGGRQGARPAGY